MLAGTTFAASILNAVGVTRPAVPTLLPRFSMAQRPPFDTPAGPEAPSAATGQDAVRPLAELRVERSRFSRLLARFGLGELTDPILRPAKPPTGQGPNG